MKHVFYTPYNQRIYIHEKSHKHTSQPVRVICNHHIIYIQLCLYGYMHLICSRLLKVYIFGSIYIQCGKFHWCNNLDS